jgi:hypothetical protein
MKIIPSPLVLLKYSLTLPDGGIASEDIALRAQLSYDYRRASEGHSIKFIWTIRYLSKPSGATVMECASAADILFELEGADKDLASLDGYFERHYREAYSLVQRNAPVTPLSSEEQVILRKSYRTVSKDVIAMLGRNGICSPDGS